MTQLLGILSQTSKTHRLVATILAVSILAGSLMVSVKPVSAAATALSDTMTRLKKSEAADHLVKFTTSTGVDGASDTITLTFANEFTVTGVDYTDIDLSYGSSTGAETEATIAATADATSWGAAFTGQVLTLTHPTDAAAGDIASADKVIVKIGKNATGGAANAQIVNPSAANTYLVSIAGTGSFTDAGKIAAVILDDDQVAVNASVDPTLTFSLTANSTSFGVLAPGIVDTADTSITLQVGTNAANGYTINVKDAGNGSNPGLYNAAASSLVGSSNTTYDETADLSSVAGYGIQASCTAGCTTDTHITSKFRQAGDVVGGLTLTAGALATFGSTLSADHTILVAHKARIAATTPAGTYVDTITYVATGNF